MMGKVMLPAPSTLKMGQRLYNTLFTAQCPSSIALEQSSTLIKDHPLFTQNPQTH